MVTVLVFLYILHTNRSPLNGPVGITMLPACPHDLQSTTVTSNYDRAVNILSTLLLRPGISFWTIPNPYRSLPDCFQTPLHCLQSVTPPVLEYHFSRSCPLGP